MYTGKMTATWLILITIAGCMVVPLIIIYFHTILPQEKAHPNVAHFILGVMPGIVHTTSINNLIDNIQV
ncbi:MAG: hypothetical protein ACTHL3_09745 [Candidatus Nitrosocosmicus sp.]